MEDEAHRRIMEVLFESGFRNFDTNASAVAASTGTASAMQYLVKQMEASLQEDMQRENIIED